MEDHRDEVVVIAAGYTKEMADFVASNPGLASRFTKHVEFENYSPEELVTIMGQHAESAGYTCDSRTLVGYFLWSTSLRRSAAVTSATAAMRGRCWTG